MYIVVSMRTARHTFEAYMYALLVLGPALASGLCSGSFADDTAANHFTADCSAALVFGSACAPTFSAGYAGGSVMCSVPDGVTPKTYAYVARPAIKVPERLFAVPPIAMGAKVITCQSQSKCAK